MRLRNKKTGVVVERTSIVTLREHRTSCSSSLVEAEEFGSIEELNEDWEDYKPIPPYLKDEKNRKVVRAWLEANDLDGATFHTSSHFFHYWNLRGFNDNGQGVDIDFFLTGEGIPNLIDGKYYTKFELCGEEEE